MSKVLDTVVERGRPAHIKYVEGFNFKTFNLDFKLLNFVCYCSSTVIIRLKTLMAV